MKPTPSALLAPVLLGLGSAASAIQPEDGSGARSGHLPLPNVVVIGDSIEDPGAVTLRPGGELRAPAADGADMLRHLNGVSAGRMGGRGLEPVIRGQSQGRLNVLLDGAYVFGACPNRMDPPSSFAATEGWDRITVLKGVQTLLWGGGGSGGTILYERENRPAEEGLSGRGGVAATSNDVDYEAFADVAYAGGGRFARGRFQTVDAGNYEDGDGNEVRSSYEETSASIAVGMTLSAQDSLGVSIDMTRAQDILYPGAGMDASRDDSDTWRLRYDRRAGDADLLIEAWHSRVDHRMDNFSNREQTAPMAMRVPSRSETRGARAQFDFPAAGRWEGTVGLDLLSIERNATRFQGMTGDTTDTVNAYLWPDARLKTLGLTAEGRRAVGQGDLTAGLRYDHVEAEARGAALDPPSPVLASPDALYRAYYGRASGKENEDNLSLLLRYERPVESIGAVFFAGLSRTMRTADATERYLASNSPMALQRQWVGNPGLDPERHRQADVGLAWRRGEWTVAGSAYYDDVVDYITPDSARGQPGILRNDGARIYRNVDAVVYGAELETRVRWGDGWSLQASAAWVRGRNDDDGRPLPQIPPLNGLVQLARGGENWEVGTRLRWADNQPRADDDPATGSGMDARETPGHGVVDAFFRIATDALGELQFGVDNVLDKTWADHLNRGNQDPFNPDPVQVNEPGRTVWANWRRGF